MSRDDLLIVLNCPYSGDLSMYRLIVMLFTVTVTIEQTERLLSSLSENPLFMGKTRIE